VPKRVKNGAQANEKCFRSIFENAQIEISSFDIDGRRLVVIHQTMEGGEGMSAEYVPPDGFYGGVTHSSP
jgi:hypothetical protein